MNEQFLSTTNEYAAHGSTAYASHIVLLLSIATYGLHYSDQFDKTW